MKTLKFLILTDHSGHSKKNSLYALTRKLVADPRTTLAFIASRADDRNTPFFAGDLSSPIYGIEADDGFQFDASATQFQQAEGKMLYWEADVVWLRLPPPASGSFFATLTSFPPASAPQNSPIIINNPAGIIETGNKIFLCQFPELTAPVKKVKTVADVQNFAHKHPIVLKPVMEYGGRGLVRIINEQVEVSSKIYPLQEWLEEARSAIEDGAYLAMKFLKNVSKGDKRILVVNGKILGASLRIPAPGQWLCNVSQGGKSVVTSVTPEEEAIVAAVAPILLEKGVVIFGADTLVDDDGNRVLSELNTNSIGGFPQAEAQTGRPILQQTIDGIYDYLYARL